MGSIRFKITALLLSLSLGEAAILSVIGYSSVNADARAVDDFREVVGSQEKKSEFVAALTRAVAQVKVFAAVRDEESLNGFDRDWRGVEKRLRVCGSFACHGVAKQPRGMLEKIWPSARRIRTEWDHVLAGGMTDPEVNAAAVHIETEAAAIVDLTDGMTRKIQERMRRLEGRIKEARRSALVLIALATLLTVLVAMGFSYVLVSSVTRPLHAVVMAARELAAGKLEHRVEVRGSGETAVLANAFNEMAADLAAHRSWLQEEIRRRDESLSVSERLATIGLVASTVAHELNNPLTSVTLNIGLALERTGPDDAVRPFLERVAADCTRCRSILGSVRQMATRRIESLAEVDVDDLMGEIERVMGTQALRRRVTLHVRPVADGPAKCRGDHQKLLQVLVNLVDNAIDASEPHSHVDVSARATDTEVTIEVRDEGSGIAQPDRDHVFDQFHTTKDHGLGLGLAIARHIVHDHGGKISFHSVTAEQAAAGGGSRGTTFEVVLPRHKEGNT